MNGKVIADATSLERSETLAAIVDAPFAGHGGAHRDAVPGDAVAQAQAKELAAGRALRQMNEGARTRRRRSRRKRALADVFWALLNSPRIHSESLTIGERGVAKRPTTASCNYQGADASMPDREIPHVPFLAPDCRGATG